MANLTAHQEWILGQFDDALESQVALAAFALWFNGVPEEYAVEAIEHILETTLREFSRDKAQIVQSMTWEPGHTLHDL